MKPNILYTGSHLLFIWIITAIFLFSDLYKQASIFSSLLKFDVQVTVKKCLDTIIWILWSQFRCKRNQFPKKKTNEIFLTASNDFFEIGKFCDIGSQRWDNCGHVQTGGSLCGSPLLCAVEHLRLVHCKCTRIIMNLYV